MSFSRSDYDGFSWIKVPRYVDQPGLSWEKRYEQLEKHHIEETTFLISEVRKLAALLEEAQKLNDV